MQTKAINIQKVSLPGSSRMSKASKDYLLPLATTETGMDNLIETQSLRREKDAEFCCRGEELQRKKKL